MEQLKDEINKTLETLHDITKWKLIIVSILSATALGLTEGTGGKLRYDLLLLVPFVCSYSDLAFYQNLIRIYVIARFLREHTADETIRQYEQFSERVRETTGAFNLDQYAQLGSSLLFSIAIPMIAVVNLFDPNDSLYLRIGRSLVWGVGCLLIIVLYVNFRRKDMAIDSASVPVHVRTPATEPTDEREPE